MKTLGRRVEDLERRVPTEPNPWLDCQFWRVEPGENVATNEKTGERLAVDDVPAYTVLIMLPEVTNEPHD